MERILHYEIKASDDSPTVACFLKRQGYSSANLYDPPPAGRRPLNRTYSGNCGLRKNTPRLSSSGHRLRG